MQRRKKSPGLGHRLVMLRLGIGIGHDAGADVEMRPARLRNDRADDDAELALTVEAKVSQRPV